MSVITSHCVIKHVKANADIDILYPQSTGTDITITANTNKPAATTFQDLVDEIGDVAFLSGYGGIDDSSTDGTTKSWSANKMNTLLTTKQDATDNTLTTTNKDVVDAINELNTSYGNKQNVTDNNLTTTSKTIVGAINEIVTTYSGWLPTPEPEE